MQRDEGAIPSGTRPADCLKDARTMPILNILLLPSHTRYQDIFNCGPGYANFLFQSAFPFNKVCRRARICDGLFSLRQIDFILSVFARFGTLVPQTCITNNHHP